MLYVEAGDGHRLVAPQGSTKLFLGGGITSCPDWQADVLWELRLIYPDSSADLIVLNPRRAEWPIGDPDASEAQIEWEHQALRWADVICFWFPCETLCPITLYELGAWSMTDKELVVGCHPDYQRLADVQIQTRLTRPDVEVKVGFADFLQELRNAVRRRVAPGGEGARIGRIV